MKATVRDGMVFLLAASVASVSSAGMVTRRWGSPAKGKSPAAPKVAVPVGYAPRAGAAPKLDGDLGEACWAAAPALNLTKTLQGNAKAAQPTEVRCLRDDKNLYVAFRCVEPATDKIRAPRRGRDAELWSDDSVEMFLGLGGSYYHFIVSAAGSTYDGKGKDRSWNGSFRAAVGRGEKQWTAELAVPLAEIAGPGAVPAEWSANFNRNRYAGGQLQESAWSPTFSGNSHAPERFGKLLLKSPPATPPAGEPERRRPMTVLTAAGGGCVVRFDLSVLPPGTKVYRADLLLFRTKAPDGNDDEALVNVEVYPLLSQLAAGAQPAPVGECLKIRPPWFDRIDATEAVRAWVGGKTNGGFFVKACPFLKAEGTCLDVAYEGKPEGLPPQVTGVKAFHRSGQTFITWREIEDPVGADEVRWGRFKTVLDNLDRARRVRYAVYRHSSPITAENLHQARLVGRVKSLSCWNVNGRNLEKAIDEVIATQYAMIHGHWNPFSRASMDGKYGQDYLMERLAIRDGGAPLPRGTGLYVHTAAAAGKACYAVVTAVDGVENTTDISAKNSLPSPVDEVVAEPQPVFQKEIPPQPYWGYRQKKLHYVRWVAPPQCNLPGAYYNWSVAVPETHGKIMPMELSLHRDDRSYYRTQYRIERDSIVVTPHDFPLKTWWYGYHESLGTLKSFRQGVIRNYTERRCLSFIDWVAKKWPVDRNRVLVTAVHRSAAGPGRYGRGGGASGALHLGIRHPKVFNMALSGGGIADYAGHIRAWRAVRRPSGAEREMQAIWGKIEWNLPTDAKTSVWDELNLTRIVRELPLNVDLPLVTCTSGGLMKPQRDFYMAMLEKGQFIMANFGVYGGGKIMPVSRTGTWASVRADVRRNLSLPCFRGRGYSTLGGPAKEPSGPLVVSDGIRRWFGNMNLPFRWGDDIVDTPSRYEVTLRHTGRIRGKYVFATVTLRRLQKFRIRPGWKYRWELHNAAGEVMEKGEVVPQDGVFVLNGVEITKAGTRLVITP